MGSIERLKDIIKTNENIVFFGGAGVSTESGIPDFRSKEGLYNQHDIQFDNYNPEYLLSRECLYHNPIVFYEFYRQKMDTRSVEPNITHKVLAKLEEQGKLKAIITQNIDGLHQKAGSKSVFEIHGTTQKNYCVKCKHEFESDYIFKSSDKIPVCTECGRPVRPDVVLYGEKLPKKEVDDAIKAIESADVLIIGGTSLSVYPAASFISYFSGDHIVVINRKELNVMLNAETDIVILDSLGNVFNQLDVK